MAPRDEAMLVHMVRTALAHDDGPIALRYPRGTAAGVPSGAPRELEVGRGEVLQGGERVALLGYGFGVQVANDAAGVLADHGLHPTVADGVFAKPLDEELVERLAADHDLVVTIEDNVLPGGFGAAVLEHLEDAFAERPERRARVLRVGLPDRYVTHGKPALLHEEVELTQRGGRGPTSPRRFRPGLRRSAERRYAAGVGTRRQPGSRRAPVGVLDGASVSGRVHSSW